MGSYIFRQRCRPRGDFRIYEVIQFLDLVKEAFGCSELYDSRSKPVDATRAGLAAIFEKKAKKLLPGIGATVDFFTIPPRKRDNNTVRIEIHTGTYPKERFIDMYNISMDGRLVPAFRYFRESIKVFKPFEAFLADGENEYRLDSYMRQQTIQRFSRPAIIRGFHYLDERMALSIGGIDYCLKAPAWRVERFCEGVLIQLVKGLFDADNPKHVQIQRDAMEYFNILEFVPPKIDI